MYVKDILFGSLNGTFAIPNRWSYHIYDFFLYNVNILRAVRFKRSHAFFETAPWHAFLDEIYGEQLLSFAYVAWGKYHHLSLKEHTGQLTSKFRKNGFCLVDTKSVPEPKGIQSSRHTSNPNKTLDCMGNGQWI